MLLRNALVRGQQTDLLIEEGTIAAIGTADATGHEVIDLDGRRVVPGLWDNHVHFSQWSLRARRVDISGATSARSATESVAIALKAEPAPSVPFIAIGFRDGLWHDAPNLADLDAASGARPVVLVSGDLHSVWLNSAALQDYGYLGHPTGLLTEDDAFDMVRRIDTVESKVLDRWADDAARQAARRGVVGIVDYEMTWNLETWRRRIEGGTDALRVEFGIYTQDLDRAIELGLRTGQKINEFLTVGSNKVLIDGSLNTRTAYCFHEYPGLEGQPSAHGMLTVAPEALVALMRKASGAGILPAVHAIGDHANSIALDAFDEVGCVGRIEHAQFLADDAIARFARLGVKASVQPDHAMDDRDVAERYWHGNTQRVFPLRSLLDSGATLLFGSDAPVSALDPWVTLAAAVLRTRDDREPWHPHQRISVDEALAASAHSSIAVGQPADLAILDGDPYSASAEELRRMPVAATLLAGRFTHSLL